MLRRHVVLPVQKVTYTDVVVSERQKLTFKELQDERILDTPNDDDVVRFQRTFANVDPSLEPLAF